MAVVVVVAVVVTLPETNSKFAPENRRRFSQKETRKSSNHPMFPSNPGIGAQDSMELDQVLRSKGDPNGC